MDLVKTYGDIIKSAAKKHPRRAFHLINTGLKLETFRTKHLADKRMPLAYQHLNTMGMELSLRALSDPAHCAWTNLFTPVELFQCFDYNCLSIEFLASYMAGFKIEDFFIDKSAELGIANTLCSYHRSFLGAITSEVFKPAGFATTTSMVCDGNIATFRYLCERYDIEHFFLDVPTKYSPRAVLYLNEQLRELISILERKSGKKFDIDRLREILERENQSFALYDSFLLKQIGKYYPTTVTLSMFMLLATHLCIGSDKVLSFFQELNEQIEKAPDCDGIRIMWGHLFPFHDETMRSMFNYSDRYLLQTTEMHFSSQHPLDVSDPLTALSKKMICNVYNQPFDAKIKMIENLMMRYQSEALIHFCHWGCRQSCGGVQLLKKRMQELDIPMLIIDGDALDRRSASSGQIRTRLEAFYEIVESNRRSGL
ncbi:2-hydroxyacyl-CoA dehydratase subunit D [Eubacterium oxidoreducens]|uniref:Benzoyl-CoA reductase/2-hydroxyglutaryl-CoA dehydratase subunit, BcrC/BadD/HgdB n=1 Tax=Eubacterium oxidoreducens TaxID=1732 RepID=A0A1G6C837_EUBOX|nr:2-hydroxyacyl-CoA dehydratase family protein [Eubacterium oxidoreducens]SDB29025.1 Benzoyl-CoA reductase/2-hydroxyglutaryl-CoA dehydratase subunit, BcrC/BadD/HgdB [Eubacterium oxidoreducens]